MKIKSNIAIDEKQVYMTNEVKDGQIALSLMGFNEKTSIVLSHSEAVQLRNLLQDALNTLYTEQKVEGYCYTGVLNANHGFFDENVARERLEDLIAEEALKEADKYGE